MIRDIVIISVVAGACVLIERCIFHIKEIQEQMFLDFEQLKTEFIEIKNAKIDISMEQSYLQSNITLLKEEITRLKAKVDTDQIKSNCDSLLISDGQPADVKVTASSTDPSCKNINHYRVNTKNTDYTRGVYGGWCVFVDQLKLQDQYVQISLTNDHIFRGVVTQGRQGHGVFNQWVTQYRVLYSTDCLTFHTDGKLFSGNFDEDTQVIHLFDKPLIGKCIRINPTNYHRWMSMRFDVIGCQV